MVSRKCCWVTVERGRVEKSHYGTENTTETCHQLSLTRLSVIEARSQQNGEVADFMRNLVNDDSDQSRQTDKTIDRETTTNSSAVSEIVNDVGQQV